ncbi:dihydroorotase [Prochlorococcus sp. MIT 1341]|uniref:dihydroorotase n=1 Tax=Prochlorococcus sp. MIT 1341 TaxID=3096221 RepID=UPI002A762667|nr:dihydroorotase [Prochlorococcus sp. MIT 1341]
MDVSPEKITLIQPDDWHVHLRDGSILNGVLPSTARTFRRAIVMPNLKPPITTVESAIQYKKRIVSALPKGVEFTPLMTVYLTENLSSEVLKKGHREGVFFAAKLYPANSTTNSSDGVRDLSAIDSLLETMENLGLPLLIHGEVTDPKIDIFDREEVFIDRHLSSLIRKHQGLRVVLEHITTEPAVQFVESSSDMLAATITPHHLHINRNAMFEGGFRSDFYCLPVAKRERHRLALRKAATSGKSCFFLGTDSAPHRRQDKESSCGCAGIFNAHYALESYAEVFEQECALHNFESFASVNGATFYGLPLNTNLITLARSPQVVPKTFQLPGFCEREEYLVPFHAGHTLRWSVVFEGANHEDRSA